MTIDQLALANLHREHFTAFAAQAFTINNPGTVFRANNTFLAIAHAMGEVAARRTRRLLVTVAPRSGKSLIGSVALPAFVLGKNPAARIICASYSSDLASPLHRQCRALMQSPLYGRLFPGTKICKSTETEIETAHHGSRFATSVGGTLTGRGGNLIVIDDPMNATEANSRKARDQVWDWFRGTVGSRLDDRTKDAMIVIMQRLHVDDLAGQLLERGGWEHLNLPAIAEFEQRIPIGRGRFFLREPGDLLDPERLPMDELEQLKRDQGSANFATQYQQNPIPEDGGQVDWSWFQTYQKPPVVRPYEWVVVSWDTASTTSELSDFSVGIRAHVTGTGDVYLLDVIRKKVDYPTLKRLVLEEARKHPRTMTLVEWAVSGFPLYDELHRQTPMIWNVPRGEKAMRFGAVTPLIEAKKVHIPAHAQWMANFKREILSFPNGTNDDQVDALSQLLTWSVSRRRTVPLQGRYSSTG